MQKQLSPYIYLAGSAVTFIGAVAQLLEISYAPYIFSVGAALLIYVQIKNFIDKGKADSRTMRFARIGLFTSLLLALAAYFMFTASNLWVIAVLIYALSSLYHSFRGNY
jgi:hypothetical protein